MAGIGSSRVVKGNERINNTPRSLTRGEIGGRFKKHFESLDTSGKHQLVKKLMQRKFGKTNWRKQVYGKSFKPGTIGGLNNRLQSGQANAKSVGGKISKLHNELETRADLQGGSTGTAALQKRLAKAEKNEYKIQGNISKALGKKETYLKTRDTALKNIAVKSQSDPSQLAKQRKKIVKRTLEGMGKKKAVTGKSGGTEAR